MDRMGLDINPQVDMNINGGVTDLYNYLKDYTTVVLQPNRVGNRNILTQEMVAGENIKYVIKYNYNLDGKNIVFNANTILEIDGGSLTNGGIVGNNTLLINTNELPEEDILINIVKSGTWRASIAERMDNFGADEEDLTKVNDKIMLKDKEYEPLENSGLGRVYLRKNLVKVYSPWMYIPVGNKVYLLYSKNNTIYAVYDSSTENGLGLKNNLVYEMEDYNLSDISAIVGDHILGYTAAGGVYTITLPDNTTITSTELNNTEILRYREGGNLEKNLLTQRMLNKANTIYHIQYDFELAENITIPANCVLEFDGGSISGEHTIIGNNTGIIAGLVKIFNTDVTFAGSWNVAEAYPEWFGAVGINGIDDSDALYCALNMSCNYVRFSKLYYISKPILLKSYVHIVGNYGMHTYKFGISVNQNFTSITHNNQTIKSIFYLNNNATAPLIFEDAYFCGSYKANTLIHFQKDAFRFNIRLYRCNLFRFYQAAVFAPGNDACVINECLIQFCGVGVVGSDEQINFEDPLHYSGITGCGRSNHLIIHKSIFYACNVGVIIKYSSDCSLNDNLFAHASLCTMLLLETKAGIFNNYIENDWNCGFWITENGNDPNIEKESHSYFNPVLANKDIDIRAYIMLNSVQLELDSVFFSNYYVRCNSAVGGNAFNNKNVSGIDSLIYITNQCVIHIGNKRIRRQYNDASSVYIYDVISKDVQDVALSKISSTEIIKYRNIIENKAGKSYAPCLHSPIISSVGKKSKSIVFGENVLLQRPDGQPANFIGSYNLSEIIGNDYFYKRSNDLVTRNSLFISANNLGDKQYRAELKFHGSVSVDRISITAAYNSGDPVTKNYAVEGYGTGLRTLYLYFSKADFIESDRELIGIYVYDNGYIPAGSTGVVSSIMVFEEGCDSPVFINLPTHGTTRPLISDNVYYEFFDENSNVNKKIFHVGTAWVDATGATV